MIVNIFSKEYVVMTRFHEVVRNKKTGTIVTGRSRLVRQSKGFTLIELLIVIVVIAILAAISVVAYTGIQRRAHTAAIISTVRNYATIFEQYAAIHGKFPASSWNCIGGDEGLPAEDGYEAGYCFKPTSGAGDHPSSPSVEAAIATVTESPPSPIIPEIEYAPGVWYRGIIFDSSASTNGGKGVIEFFIPGAGAKCPIGKRVTWNTTYNWTRCDYPLSVSHWG